MADGGKSGFNVLKKAEFRIIFQYVLPLRSFLNVIVKLYKQVKFIIKGIISIILKHTFFLLFGC